MMFRSAGFLSADNTCPKELVSVLAERGIEARKHRSYRLDETSVNAADLLLTMEASHVQKATMLNPDAFAKIVPLKQAAEVVERSGQPQLSLEEFLTELNHERDPLQYLGTGWDVDDPYGGRVKAYQRAVGEIDQLVRTTLSRLR